MPDLSVRSAAKFWVALLALVFATIAATMDAPQWVSVLAAVLGAVAVYLVPNTPTTPPDA
jgi:hypothetical protein